MTRVVFKTLKLGDVEDPEIYLGAAVWDWFQTEHGAWVREHARDLVYVSTIDYASMGHTYKIAGLLEDEDEFLYKIKWGEIE
jgi:hypothetical protein